jgi:uncharacterized RDD family membrane protein YckC
MEAKFNINTSQNVNIELKIAGIGDRLIAIIIDYTILSGLGILFTILFTTFSLNQELHIIVMSIFGFIVLFYHFFMEWLFKGQTFGKKYRNIKVIHRSGIDASVFQLLVRNLIRIVDSIYGLGLLIIFLSKKSQRLGDLAAGTIVIKTQNDINLYDTAFLELDENYIPTFKKIEILKLEEKDMEMIKEIIDRTSENMNWNLVGALANSIKSKSGITNEKMKSLKLLQTVLKDFQFYNFH